MSTNELAAQARDALQASRYHADRSRLSLAELKHGLRKTQELIATSTRLLAESQRRKPAHAFGALSVGEDPDRCGSGRHRCGRRSNVADKKRFEPASAHLGRLKRLQKNQMPEPPPEPEEEDQIPPSNSEPTSERTP